MIYKRILNHSIPFIIQGDAVAKFCGTHLYEKIMNSPSFQNGRYKEAIRIGYHTMDRDLAEGKEKCPLSRSIAKHPKPRSTLQ